MKYNGESAKGWLADSFDSPIPSLPDQELQPTGLYMFGKLEMNKH
jgi:hypothetical protein